MTTYIAYTIATACLCFVVVSCRPSINSVDDQNKLHFFYYPTAEEQIEIVFNDSHSLKAANLKPATKTVLLIDGFTAPPLTPMAWDTKDTFTGRNDTNVIIIDWSAYSGNGRPVGSLEAILYLYLEVFLTGLPKAAQEIAEFITFLNIENEISFDNVVLIGHSMGAHTAGYTGRTIISKYGKQVSRIIGLDPSLQISAFLDGPLRLRAGDATVVEVYITDRNYYGDSSHTMGDITIFVNGGDNQPCQFLSEDLINSGEAGDVGIFCANHIFSWKFYNYMRYNETLQACPCRGAACLCQGCSMKCDDDGISVGPNIPEEARGAYHIKTGYLDWS